MSRTARSPVEGRPVAGVTRAALQAIVDRERFVRPWRFRVVAIGDGMCTLRLPMRRDLERPGRVMNGPALMAAADCAMWFAIKTRLGLRADALTTDLATAFLAAATGDVLCTARVLRLGKRRIYGVAECRGRDGTLWTHHTVIYARIERPHE